MPEHIVPVLMITIGKVIRLKLAHEDIESRLVSLLHTNRFNKVKLLISGVLLPVNAGENLFNYKTRGF